MDDAILITLIKESETATPPEQVITLIVGGFLISGCVISYNDYIKQEIFENKELTETESSWLEPGDCNDIRHYLHVKDAKIFTGNTNNPPIPTNTGLTLRIALNNIHGYSLSKLVIEKQ